MVTPRQHSNYFVDPKSRFRYSRAVRVGDRVIVSQTAPRWPDGSVDPDPEVQARRCLEIISEGLKEVGSSLDDVVRTWLWQRHPEDAVAVARAHASVLGHIKPAVTQVCVAGFLDPRWSVEIEAEAVVGAPRERVPLATYPGYQASEDSLGWSRAYKVGNRVLVSCTAPIWPEGPRGAYDPDPEAQANRCWEVVNQALKAGGAGPEHVVRSHIWLKDGADGPPTARAHAAVFGSVLPATTQLVLQGYLNPHWRVEVEAEADLTPGRQNILHYVTLASSAQLGWSRAVRVGNRVLVSCTAPRWDDGHTEPDTKVQAHRCWEIICGALKEAGAGPEHVVRTRIYIRHAKDGQAIADFSQEAFASIDPAPALTLMTIHGYLNPAWRVEMECEAVI